jgi:hypothetical protein
VFLNIAKPGLCLFTEHRKRDSRVIASAMLQPRQLSVSPLNALCRNLRRTAQVGHGVDAVGQSLVQHTWNLGDSFADELFDQILIDSYIGLARKVQPWQPKVAVPGESSNVAIPQPATRALL